MYYSEELKGKITESGQRYSPRLHRQNVPFIALYRATHNTERLSTRFIVKCILRSIRDVHDMPVQSKFNENGYSACYLRQQYAAIWEPALGVFSDMLAGIGLAKSSTASAHANVYKQIQDLGFDLLLDSYYAGNLTLNSLAGALAAILFEPDTEKISKFLNNLERRGHVLAGKLPILGTSLREANRENLEMLTNCVRTSGNLIALNYFVSFHSHFKLQDSTLNRATEAILNGDYCNDSVLQALYNDVKPNSFRLQWCEDMHQLAGRGTNSASYTGLFNS